MLENKKFNLVISFVLAFALWFYVVGQMNPQTKKTYRDIPIMLINEQTLNDNGLAVLNTSDKALRVTVSGKRDALGKLSKADVVATVDLQDAAEGHNKLSINLRIPENIEIDNQSITDINVNVEERVTKTRDIKVTYTGKTESGTEPATIKMDPENVKVSGAKSLVERVSYVSASVDTEELSNSLSSSTSILTAVTASGNAVDNISISEQKCKITSILYKTKTVKLTVPVKDDSKDGYTRSISCQKTISIKGPATSLDRMRAVEAAEIDITGLTENKRFNIVPVLPEDVFVADKDKNIKLTVKVSRKKTKKTNAKEVKSFTYTEDDIELRNTGNKEYQISQEQLEVQVSGTEAQLSRIKSSDIILYVDLDGAEADSGVFEIKAECSKSYADIAVIPSKVTVSAE